MKRLILFFLLSFSLYGQIITNRSITRGDSDTLTFYVPKDITSYELYFTVKQNSYITTVREIYKRNLLAGGTGISANYDIGTDTTTINIILEPSDTETKDSKKYYYDIVKIKSGSRGTVFYGDFIIKESIFSLYSDGGIVVFVPQLTEAERDLLSAVNGMIIYNLDTDTFNFYENGEWLEKLSL